jgi:membrane associated rhomboid family serine protease
MNNNGILRRQFAYSYNNITLYLIIANLIVFLISSQIRGAIVTVPEGQVDIQAFLSMVPILVNRGFIWQFFTYMFAHASFNHLFFNMLGLFIFGTQVEREMGSKEFLLFYLVTGMFAGILSYGVYLLSYALGGNVVIMVTRLLGASGALYAVMLAFATYYPNARIFVMGILPMRSVTLIMVYAALALYNQITGSAAGVAHMTHLAGFIFAFLYFVIRFGHNPIKSWRNGS